MTFLNKDWRDANPDGTGDTSTPTNAAAFEDLERRLGGAAGGNTLVAQGCVGNGIVDDEPAFQTALDVQRLNPVWLEGEAKTYQITKPLILGPSAKLRQMNIRAAPTFAPADSNGAMVMLAQGTVTQFTADVSTDVFTTIGNHQIPADGIGVVVKGTVPAGTTAGRVYYVRDRTATTYKLGTSRVFATGTIATGSNQVAGVAVSFASGSWAIGHSISGTGIPANTIVEDVGAGTLTISNNATQDGFRGLTGVSTAINLLGSGSGASYHEVLSLNKLYMEDVFLNGNNVANLNGIAVALQQQTEFYKVRWDNFPGKGMLLNGQQAVFIDCESITCGTALHLEGAYYMNFYAFNAERCNKAVYVAPAQTVFPAGFGAGICSFVGPHFEMKHDGGGHTTSSSVCVDMEGQASEMVFDTMTVSMNHTDQTIFHVHTGSSVLSGYDIRSVRCSTGGPGGNPTFMQDDDRGHTVETWEDVVVNIGELKATPQPTSTNYHDPGAHAILLPGGGYLRYGPQNVQDPKLASRAGSTQTGLQAVWRDSSDVDKVSIAANGLLTTTNFKMTAGGGTARVLTSDADGDATWQALPAGTEVISLPPFKPGRYVHAGNGTEVNQTPGSDEIGRVIYTPILWTVDRERSIDRAGVKITAAGAAGSVVRFGLYEDDGTMGPGALIADFGTAAATTTGWCEVTAVQTMLPAVYWLAVVAQVAPPQWERLASVTWGRTHSDPMLGFGKFGSSIGAVTGAFPDPAAVSYTGNLDVLWPAAMVRMAA